MRAILVSVDYSDLLAVTLPYNRHHFSEVYIVTSLADAANVLPIAERYDAKVLQTDLFYAGGATFAKWTALEWGLDRMSRDGWICLMDADVLWPKDVKLFETDPHRIRTDLPLEQIAPGVRVPTLNVLRHGCLYTPLRRMFVQTSKPVPPESEWSKYPIHRNVAEWAGYSQIFHASDPVLGPAPWHETNWKHAGGADSFFQMKWPKERKIRPPFEVLHLGPAGENWYGRASRYLDGTIPEGAEEKKRLVNEIWTGRRAKRIRHGPDSDVYRDEKF